MSPPIQFPFLGLFGIALLILFVLLELHVIEVVYHRLGISHRAITALLLLTIFGSYINIPVATAVAQRLVHDQEIVVNGIPYVVPHVQEVGRTVIAINVGGALIPTLLSLYLLFRGRVLIRALIATAIVSAVVYHFSQIVPGAGITVPTFIPGIVAAVVASVVDRRRSAAVAWIGAPLTR